MLVRVGRNSEKTKRPPKKMAWPLKMAWQLALLRKWQNTLTQISLVSELIAIKLGQYGDTI